jgi:hypothetical protein
MAIKVKEMKDDAIVNIPVNKSYYLMMKGLSYYLFTYMGKVENPDEYLKDTLSKKYQDLDDLQKSFYTVALFLGQVEQQTRDEEKYIEKEILEPGDEGYIPPKQD